MDIALNADVWFAAITRWQQQLGISFFEMNNYCNNDYKAKIQEEFFTKKQNPKLKTQLYANDCSTALIAVCNIQQLNTNYIFICNFKLNRKHCIFSFLEEGHMKYYKQLKPSKNI